ncbi:hypothetical protein FB384_004411 [Prauserella sediminis]|uniref:Uncharacterized protein n=1 Tax=Prauserella sediminis TaxID=577680 RepID=A0A839XVP5_9PSEU|nr:hypothetical protein [Prauserella sediminis]MBB3665454.1 hypothetical protein [Prauserella sediminis]
MAALSDGQEGHGAGRRYVGVGHLTGSLASAVAGTNNTVNNHFYHSHGPGPGGTVTSRVDSRGYRKYLRPRFVRPLQFEAAGRALAKHGTLFLSGEPGSGRKSAALMLLWERFPGSDASCRRLSLDEDDGDDRLHPDSIQRNDRLLLDLTEERDPERLSTVEKRLATFVGAVEDMEAALVVLLPPRRDQDPRLRELAVTESTVTIERPNGTAVFTEHVLQDIDADLVDGRAVRELDAFLAAVPMRDVAELARRTVEARNVHRDADFAYWLAEARKSAEDYREEVTEAIGATGPEQRALLLTVAVLEGGHTDAIHRAQRQLLEELRFSRDEIHLLEQRGIEAALGDIGVVVDASHAVRFGKVRYQQAVADHFWMNYPDMRQSLATWVAACVELDELSEEDRGRVVERFVRQACRHNRIPELCAVIRRWAGSGNRPVRKNPPIRWADTALDLALRWDEDAGQAAQQVRRQIYEWASDEQLGAGLAQVLVEVCAEVVADTHPDQALVRLRRLAWHRDDAVATKARSAVVTLTGDTRVHRRFLWRMADWMGQERPSDVTLFLEASSGERVLHRARPRAPIVDAQAREQLRRCWAGVLPHEPSWWRDRLREWLDEAVNSPHRDAALTLLLDASGANVDILARLYVVARDWAAGGDPADRVRRRDVLERLNAGIARSQGLTESGGTNGRDKNGAST